ncbi:MAG: hypothetical protein A2Y62_17845 [Candidatus Fischerbacteria bacterium RBG_13_37_8]|uniref:Glycosyltransferase RgtA/B/C/D-like domain-containing protein n=1 Tax=Candidatus Fischerbacteria bacterium RBG_13_37_8 TaxID=1817863 RepID=A0A1F5VP99_9BACT|nr:MAG: hypothetical protein A2Y62_17845 [Candidatus Fischerbacteria bacterium RBG_13_37_8]
MILLFTHLFYWWIIIILTLTGIIANLKFLNNLKQDLLSLNIFHSPNAQIKYSFAAILISIQTAIILFAASTPPYFYDSMVYHLAMPAKYLQYHSFFYYPDIFFTSFPMNMSLFFAVPLAFKTDMATQIINVIFILMTALTIIEFCTHYFSKKTAAWASVLFLTTPLASLSAFIPAVEPSLTFYSLISFLLFLHYIHSKHSQFLILSGVAAGIALGIKYTHAAYLLMILFFLIPFFPKTWSYKTRLITIFKLLIIFMLVFAPWMLKNLVIHADPLYPYFSKFSSSSAEIIYQLAPKANFSTLLKHYLLTPIYMNFKTMGAAGILGPFFIILLPWLIAGSRKQHYFFKLLLVSSISGIITFAITIHWLRLFLPIVPLMCILYALALFNNQNNLLEKTAKYAAYLVISFNILTLLVHVQNFGLYTYAFGSAQKNEFLPRLVEYYPAAKFLDRNSPDMGILLIGESRTYYFKQTCFPHFPPERPITVEKWLARSDSIQQFLEILKKNNIKLVLFNNHRISLTIHDAPISDFFHVSEPARTILDEFMTLHLLPVHSDDFYSLYKIK